MNTQLKSLASGRWAQFSFMEQMANIGSEVERSLNWKAKGNADYSQKAFDRALELLDLSLDEAQGFARLKELARLREALVDFFFGSNEFKSSEGSWKKYFFSFMWAARRKY